ncbi:MAG: anthranilate phosphoribosyltransferase [Oscillospiraceae bacterium]|jgi:anthranilate phosphoribosyltransferase|nr:anthranilate phosphoribosyltransferase [Oscillospiraceae bacterium]
MINTAISRAVGREDLSQEETRAVMDEIMRGECTPAQIAAFLTAMRMKGESIDEITACAAVMRRHCQKLAPDTDVCEIVGTGGDEAFTFNISTVSSFVVSAGGVPVAKHGNRSVSSKCGSADVLEALGAKLDIPAGRSAEILREIGLCFLFAPLYHSSMKYAAPVRREMGVRTIFNILGPLANPAGANMQLLGVYDEALVQPLAKVLMNLGVKRAMVVHGHDGLDEITLTSSTTVCEVRDGRMDSFFLDPRQFGFSLCSPEDLTGGGPAENAEIARRVLGGERGPKRDAIVLNSAICLYMARGDKTIRECVRAAGEIIDSGRAMAQMERFVRLTNE